MREKKFATLSGMFRAIFSRILSPKPCIMQSFGLQLTRFPRSPIPQTQEEVPDGTWKLIDPLFAKPPPQGLLNNAKAEYCFSGVAPANQTKERAKTRSSRISPIFVNSGVFPCENKADSHRTLVPECPWEKFMNWPFFGLVCRGDS